MDLRPDNPCDRIGPVLGVQGKVAQHMRELPHGEPVAFAAGQSAATCTSASTTISSTGSSLLVIGVKLLYDVPLAA